MGASAGGLDAFQKFFRQMPPDSGMAFVIVVHLDPRHESLMPELLGRVTNMPAEQIRDETRVAPDHIYVIPANASLTIEAGILRVVTPPTPERRRTPIDTLFRSLAEDQGQNAVCILLSGSGADGSLGLRAVKEHGGLTMAQSPESAQHDSIVRSAIATGMVDLVLPPEQMPAQLVEYAVHLKGLRDDRSLEAFVEEAKGQLRNVWELLRRSTGHDFSRYKQATVIRRMQRRMQVLQTDSVAAYVGRLKEDPGEVDRLFKDLLIGVTRFFRDPEAFDALAREVIPKVLHRGSADDPVRVWTPACATGEEAYSVGILLREAMERLDVTRRVQVFAGDIDEEALELARQGRYPEGIADAVAPERLERFFVKDGHGYRVAKPVRETCIFSRHSVIKDPPFSRLDLIVCRNLLIYLEAEPQRQLAAIFHYSLRPGGYLFLGSSESLEGPPHLFRAVDQKHRIFQRTETVVAPPFEALQPRFAPTGPPSKTSGGGDDAGGLASRPRVMVQALERLLLDKYAPAWVIVNVKGDAVYFSPRTGRYLEPATGAPSSDLVSMARKGLRLELRTAIHKAVKTGTTVVREGLSVETNGDVQRINLVVRPVGELEEEATLFMVVFQELGPPKSKEQAAADGTVTWTPDSLTQQLESELKSTKEALQATIEELETSNEELKSSNEELLSTNEELQSANEELQTSKEELQSLNEELETVNAELSQKVEQLDRANSDLDNLFHSTHIPTLFLDGDLHIKKFTQAADALFHIIATDVGRPITDIAARFPAAGLAGDVREVLRTLTPAERRIRSHDLSAAYVMRILPYRRRDLVVDGVVVTFADVTEIERALEQRTRLAAIVESSQDAIVGSTLAGVITTWNAAATRLLGYSEAEAVGAGLDLIVPPDRHEEAERISQRLARGESIQPFETIRQAKHRGRIAVSLAISIVRDAAGEAGVAYAFRDITELTRGREALREEARRKDEFLTSLSHELRNPLAPLRNCLEILQHPASGASLDPQLATMMDRQLGHLTGLVDQLLDASRISSGKIALQRQAVDLEELVRTAAEDYRPSLEAAGLELELKLIDRPVWIFADAGRIAQVLANLLGNAKKFTERGGKVTVTVGLEPDEGSAVVSVRDTGVGMELEMLGRLFVPFAQARTDPTGADGGLGLGLSLVKGLIESHEGTVQAWSDGPGRGSELTFRLPLQKGPAVTPGEPRPPDTPNARPRRILVLEDNADTAASLKIMLELAGHDVETVSDGEVALQKASAFQPDVMLCDIALPGAMDGYAVASAVRRDPALESIYLIALTGFGRAEDREHARRVGFNVHLTKPASPATLRRLLARVPSRARP